MDENTEKINKLAGDVLHLARSTLLVNLRFLDMALGSLALLPVPEYGGIGTDGRVLAYAPVTVLRRYRDNRVSTVRGYLHSVFHCVFRHMYVHSLVDRDLWNLAADVAVEHCITSLNLPSLDDGLETRRRTCFDRLEKAAGILTAEKIYRVFLDTPPSAAEREEYISLFCGDDHALWYISGDEKSALLASSPDGGDDAGNPEPQQSPSGNPSSDEPPGDGEPQDAAEEQPGDASSAALDREREELWKSISDRMQTEMETFGRRQGFGAGGLLQNLKAVNREKYNYESFLKKFAVMGESMKINDDEFDYVHYTYGLKLYKKVPLVEPLEYKDVKRIREFVIAIDTSGSTSGELVQTFLQKTWNVLQSTESFFSKVNIHIIQCDADIQEAVKITSLEEFDEYRKTMCLRGLGGTDFRPVFQYVDKLVEHGDFQNLKGLIYFTDGYGTFPARKPDYETAFVFIDDEYNNPEVPPWAIRLVLQREEI